MPADSTTDARPPRNRPFHNLLWCLRLAGAAALILTAGCAVPQPRGEGTLQRVVESTTGRPYYLYLPKDYVEADEAKRAKRRWPLVVTFHGMKPYDGARAQALEWEQEADRYGFIVVAPVLKAFVFLFGEFPLRTINPAFKSDELATLAVLDHVLETTPADPGNVLSTSWSSGGYLAHYMLNRHPDRFTCLAVRQSNYSGSVLDPTAVSRSLYHPVLVLSTQNDFAVCKKESREAIEWYETHGYKNLAWVYINRLGHERTPDTAADFFARVCGVKPNRPPAALVRRQAIDGNPTGLALLRGKMEQLRRPPGTRDTPVGSSSADPGRPTQPRRTIRAASRADRNLAVAASEAHATPPVQSKPRREQREKPLHRTSSPIGIRVSSAIGFEPLLLVYSADCPSDWHRTADFYWTLDGKTIGHGINGQRTITEPGDHTLELLVITNNGAEHRTSRRIRVVRRVGQIRKPEGSGTQ